MMTGDHLQTARSVAIQCGIINDEEANEEDVVMTGKEFREKIGSYNKVMDYSKKEYRIDFMDRKKFDELKKKVKVIARCTSEDKFVFVCGIKSKGGLVGMTGSSISDAEALRKADVGLSMGTGCDVAKDNSDLVILDNNFESIYKSIMWGRAIFDNVRKFLQFQLTINIVICVITILGGFTIGRPPLNVIQMLWTNLIMDILGAIAIGTEPFRAADKNQTAPTNRISRKDTIIKSEMLRQVICQSAYQLVVMIFLMYFGHMIFFEESFNLVTERLRDENGIPTNRMSLNTMCFHTFILMNWFNTINCRVLDDSNVFKTLLNNWYLWVIMGVEMFLQLMMVKAGYSDLGSALLGTAPMSTVMIVVCWIFGAFTLVVNIGLKKIPIAKFEFAAAIDLESGNDDTMYDRMANMADDVVKKAGDRVKDAQLSLIHI